MTLKTYIEHLNKLAKDHPKAIVVFSRDEEGNGFEEVKYMPAAGEFCNGEFDSEVSTRINAVCVN